MLNLIFARIYRTALQAGFLIARLAMLSAIGAILTACHSNHNADKPMYAITGSITGLSAAGLVLENKGGDNLTVAANATSFQFATSVAAGGSYQVTVATQPAGLTCGVSNGSGTNLSATVGNVSIACTPVVYAIAGTISGLTAPGLILQNDGGNDLAVPASATSFQFATRVPAGGNYNVTILSQPAGLTCSVGHGSGSHIGAPVTNVNVVCSAITRTIAGTITGLTASGLVLQNNGGDNFAANANTTAFHFSAPVAFGGPYSVTVSSQPTGLTCTVSDGVGSHVSIDITNIVVTCSTSTFAVGGTVSGLTGSGLVLQNNGGDNLSVATSSASFVFQTPVAYGSHYAVTVLTQPAGQTCTVSDGSASATSTVTNVAVACANIVVYAVTASGGPNGTIAPAGVVSVNSGGSQGFVATPATSYAVDQWLVDGTPVQSGGGVFTLSNVTANHTVAVAFAQATLTPSVAALALATSGAARQVVLTNNGTIAATNVSISYPTWPMGTTASSSCGGTLAAADSCTLTIMPGPNATSNCSTGLAPTPGTVTVTADDAAAGQVSVLVLNYGCIYQEGFVYSIDDTTPTAGSIGGKAAALMDSLPGQASPISGNPNWGGYGIDVGPATDETNSQGANDGSANTAIIMTALGCMPSSIDYAACLCATLSVDAAGNIPCAIAPCYTSWYLPALCELGSRSGTCAAGTPNIQTQLFEANIATLGLVDGGYYWSSTEFSGIPMTYAWGTYFSTGGSVQLVLSKDYPLGIRCTRLLTL